MLNIARNRVVAVSISVKLQTTSRDRKNLSRDALRHFGFGILPFPFSRIPEISVVCFMAAQSDVNPDLLTG